MRVMANLHYQILRQIGVGQGMNSLVYLANDPQLGGDFAVKEIDQSKFGNDVQRYFQEAQTMFAVAHPNITPIQYACARADKICLAMPFFQRGSLTDLIQSGPLTCREVLRLSQGLLAGLARIHAAGFVHFDIKPSNVLFDNNNVPMLADFGQARQVSGGVIKVSEMYAYITPPETLQTGTGSLLSDIYQMGLLLYRAVNGDPHYKDQLNGLPWDEVKRRIVKGKIPDRQSFLPHVPPRLRTIIRKALRRDPRERFSSATEMARALGRVTIGVDWEVRVANGGELSWRAARPGQPDLEVRLLKDGSLAWRTQCSTIRHFARRARSKSNFWRDGMSHAVAMRHLNEFFAELS